VKLERRRGDRHISRRKRKTHAAVAGALIALAHLKHVGKLPGELLRRHKEQVKKDKCKSSPAVVRHGVKEQGTRASRTGRCVEWDPTSSMNRGGEGLNESKNFGDRGLLEIRREEKERSIILHDRGDKSLFLKALPKRRLKGESKEVTAEPFVFREGRILSAVWLVMLPWKGSGTEFALARPSAGKTSYLLNEGSKLEGSDVMFRFLHATGGSGSVLRRSYRQSGEARTIAENLPSRISKGTSCDPTHPPSCR